MKTSAELSELLHNKNAKAILLFDGVCTVCNRSVNFLIKQDKHRYLRYASLQSEVGKHLAKDLSPHVDSIIYIDKDNIYSQSDAVLHIGRLLPFPYKLVFHLRIIPKSWRDFLYSAFAKKRYRWFGKQDQCRIPTPEERNLFI